MSERLQEYFAKAIATGELIAIIYHSGSQPGTIREIQPIAVFSKVMRAYDGNLNDAKAYMLSLIEIPGCNSIAPSYDENATPSSDDFHTVKEFFESEREHLRQLGWHVEATESRISLHDYSKNGKPRKAPAVSLSFDEFVTEEVFNEDYWIFGNGDCADDFVTETRKSKRPHHVSSPTYSSSGFSKFNRACAVFMEEAERHKPRTKA
jgi:hypothetical protein